MYGFHKIKNEKSFHEFKHPQFKKDKYDDLAHIKRKNLLIGKEGEQKDKDLDADEYVKLKEKLDSTKVTLESVTHQNMTLISANKEVAGQLYNFKQEYEQKLAKFFFMFYFIVHSKSEGLLNMLKKTLFDLGIAYDDNTSDTIEQRTMAAYRYINDQVLINNNYDHAIMNKLLNAFAFYFNVGNQNLDDLYFIEETQSRIAGPLGDEAGSYFRAHGHTFMSSETPDLYLETDNFSENKSMVGKDSGKVESEKILDQEGYLDHDFNVDQIYECERDGNDHKLYPNEADDYYIDS